LQEESALVENSVWCRVLKAFEKLATNAVFCCMTLESVYLHQLLARALRGHPNMLPFYIAAASESQIIIIYNQNRLAARFKKYKMGFAVKSQR